MNIEKFNVQVAKIIKDQRVKKGIKQTDLALKIGINQSTISKIEAGKLTVSAYHWGRICKVLKINVDTILKVINS